MTIGPSSKKRDWLWVIGFLGFGACAALGTFLPSSPASTTDLSDPTSSCAKAENLNTTQQRRSTADTINSNNSRTLVVVSGRQPINTSRVIAMGQPVTVCVMGLRDWIYKQKNSPANLRLFIGGNILANTAPSAVSPSDQEYLNFSLQMDTEHSDDWKAWAAIVSASRQSEDNMLPISVGLADTKQVFESTAAAVIKPYPRRWPYLLALFAFLLAALAYLAVDTDLLRYAIGPRPTLPLRSPFSLGLVQMSFWFYLAVAAYVYICVTTHQIHIPMGSVLGLLGISATTGLAAIAVDKQKEAASQNQKSTLLAEQASLSARVKDIESTTVTAGSAVETELLAKKFRFAQVDALLAQLPSAPPPPTSKGFFEDILNDGDGVSFHRFQIAVWTIVVGIVFVWAVYRNISMPDLDASLLTLMGISSGTYVGFKFPEKPKT